jgi:hypothetical protein
MKNINQIIDELFSKLVMADKYVAKFKSGTCFNYKLTKINTIVDIPKPMLTDRHFFFKDVSVYINEHATYSLLFTCKIKNRHITIRFVTFHELTTQFITSISRYVYMIYMWIYILDEYSTRECSKYINLYVYLTPFAKILPDNQLITLSTEHVNSGYTSGCKETTEIVIFRKEEWFKVFLHETFHNFGLDFSEMNLQHINRRLHDTFNVNIQYNLYESYCETWARIVYVMFYTYNTMSSFGKAVSDTFRTSFHNNMIIESKHSLLQCLKILNFMNLNYAMITRKTPTNITICNHLYKENTSVFSYYIITSILINNYTEFMTWCHTNNTTIFQFKQTPQTLDDYLYIIHTHSHSKRMLNHINNQETILQTITSGNNSHDDPFRLMFKSLRMTSIDM